jgi:cation diffusion facilitator CzcD-associated flavoprotein CzcO
VRLISGVEAYPKDVSNGLSKEDLRKQIQRYAFTFHLDGDVLLGTTVTSTSYDVDTKTWTLELSSKRTVVCKQLVIATGVCSNTEHIPDIQIDAPYKGISMHSKYFKNGKILAERGVQVSRLKSLALMGCVAL